MLDQCFRFNLGLIIWLCFFYTDACALCYGEVEMADKTNAQIAQEWPLRASNDSLTTYIQRLGEHILASSTGVAELQFNNNYPNKWHFFILRDLSVNAFSIGNGYIYLTEGSVAFVKTEAELVALLSHEIGHQLAGHFCSNISQDYFGSFIDIFAHSVKNQQYSSLGTMSLALDPLKEQQADQVALLLLKHGGYDPRALLDLAQSLPSNVGTHSKGNNRILFLEKMLVNSRRIFTKNSTEFDFVKSNISN